MDENAGIIEWGKNLSLHLEERRKVEDDNLKLRKEELELEKKKSEEQKLEGGQRRERESLHWQMRKNGIMKLSKYCIQILLRPIIARHSGILPDIEVLRQSSLVLNSFIKKGMKDQ